ncbi:MAG: metallophosphoesterase [Candidatus Thorarchaeota archaeon]
MMEHAISMEILFDDRSMIIRNQDTSVLVISDLHLGFERTLRDRGTIVLPQDVSMMKRIERLVEVHDASRLYMIGDIKHTILADNQYNWERVPGFMESVQAIVETVVIPGNHDGDLKALLPRNITVLESRGVVIDNEIGLLHGHSWPAPALTEALMVVIGHNHPSVRRFEDVSSPEIGRGGRVRHARSLPVIVRSKLNMNCVRKAMGILEESERPLSTLITLPHFNELISGVPVNYPGSEFQGPFFENGCVDLSTSEVLSERGVFLGTVGWLREQLNETIKSRPPR